MKGEAEIVSSEDLFVFEIDGVFRINGKPVLLYIRDQSRYIENIDSYTNENYESEYKYHLMCCRTVHNIISDKKEIDMFIKTIYLRKKPDQGKYY